MTDLAQFSPSSMLAAQPALLSGTSGSWVYAGPTPLSPRAQQAVLENYRQQLEPLRIVFRLPAYDLVPGTRLRSLWGRCRHFPEPGRRPEIAIRCTADGDLAEWRRPGAIVGTLLHELAHLKWRSHGPRFWALYRQLVDAAAAAGVYRAHDDDPGERARGAAKLAGTAADEVARAALARRRERAAANRLAARRWRPGMQGRVDLRRGALADARVLVVGVARGWLTVEVPATGRRYRVAASALLDP